MLREFEGIFMELTKKVGTVYNEGGTGLLLLKRCEKHSGVEI